MSDTGHSPNGGDVPKRAIVLLASAAFSSSVNLRVCDPLLPQVAHDFAVTPGQAAAIITAFAIGYGLTQLLFGPIGDRYGKYLIVALTSIGAGLLTGLSALMPTLDSLTWARFAVGALAAAPIPLAFAWIGDVVAYEHRQGVLARFLSAQFTGIVLGQAAGGWLGDVFGWRTVFEIVALLHVLAGVSMLAELRFNPGAQPPVAATPAGLLATMAGMVGIARRPWVVVMLATVFMEAYAFYGAFAYIGADLHHRFGVGLGLVGLLVSSYGGGAILYSFTARKLLALLGERGLALAGGVFLGATLLALAVTPWVAVVPLIMVLMGLAFYMLHNTLQTHATQMAPEARGLGVSLFAFGLFLGQAIGVAVNGPIIDRFGAPPVYVIGAIMLPLIGAWFRDRLIRRTLD